MRIVRRPKPDCCMRLGGWSGDQVCGVGCDGVPYPFDPAWKLVKDEHGCDVWSSAGSTGRTCGASSVDAGEDTSGDGSSDTSSETSADVAGD